MERILEKLYYGELRPCEQERRKDPAYEVLWESKSRKEEHLRGQMGEGLQAEFDSWMADYLKLISMESCQSFCEGFKLGARLMAELGADSRKCKGRRTE